MPGEKDQFDLISKAYTEDATAQIDKVNAAIPGGNSLFNPFNIFRYSKFGLSKNSSGYQLKYHRDGTSNDGIDAIQSSGILLSGVQSNAGNSASEILKNFTQIAPIKTNVIENPSASTIINWAQSKASKTQSYVDGPTPYSATDFMWCKWYGKVPNNRLVTLRRYPIPVEDNVIIAANKMPLVPISQAVTWFGKDVGNPMKNVINLGWGFNWKSIGANEIQDIKGNELSVEDLLAAIGANDVDENVVATIKNIISGDGKTSLPKLAGIDSKFNEYVVDAYGQDGPYWNRILGPVNVINRTYIRDRGYKDNKENSIKLKFEYSLRSYGSLNPKIAFLDLVTNFLSLTYNTAPFWGGGARYFEREGVTIPALKWEKKFFEGDVYGGIKSAMSEINAMGTERFKEIFEAAKKLVDEKEGAVSSLDEDLISEKKRIDDKAKVSVIEKALAPRLGVLMQKPLVYRSILDGRAIGEWHVTVGNPMNPIAHIGNLIVTDVDMDFGEILGVDDFPTEITFTVTLKHGRQRAKQDIESMFNSGNGAMSFNELSPPSSARNSYGNYNTALANSANQGVSPDAALDRINNPDAPDETREPVNSSGADDYAKYQEESGNTNFVRGVQAGANGDGAINSLNGGVGTNEVAIKRSRQRVGGYYGEGFQESGILASYFNELKTKD